MKVRGTRKISCQQSVVLRAKEASQLRKLAELSGIPVFALRMAVAQNLSIAQSETTVRRRHD